MGGLLCLPDWLSLNIGLPCPWLQFMWSTSGSQNYTAGFSGPPAFRLQILELLSLHNHASQFLIINYTCMHIHTHPVALVSLENTNLQWKAHLCLSLYSNLALEASACHQQTETGCLCCQRAALPWRPKVSPSGNECRALWTGTMLSGQTIRAQANLAFCPHISFVGSREGQVWMKIHINSCFSGGMTVVDTCRALTKNICERGL